MCLKFFLVGLATFISVFDVVSSLQHFKPNGTTCSANRTSFECQIKRINWNKYITAYNFNDTKTIGQMSEILLRTFLPFLVKPPGVKINTTCQPPPLSIPSNYTCIQLKHSRKIGVILHLEFDIDALEIHLNELGAIADKFFITESIRPIGGYARQKPLLWNVVKDQKRFAPFLEKVVYFIIDDSNLSQLGHVDTFEKNRLLESVRWHKFLHWNDETSFFANSDILGFGDADQVPFRNNIFYLKNCKIDSPVDIGIWFPVIGITTASRTHRPVRDHPFTLGDPTYWTLGKIKRVFNTSSQCYCRSLYTTNMRGNSQAFLLGGMYLSRYAYQPLRFMKLLTAEETEMSTFELIIEIGELYLNDKFEEAESKLNYIQPHFLDGIVDLEYFQEHSKREADAIVKIPWFYDCNRKRYPVFQGTRDLRLDS